MSSLEIQQRQVQKQAQVLSQKTIQSLEILSLSSDDLLEKIYKSAQENPALEIKENQNRAKSKSFDGTRISSTNAQGQMASDNFQKALEAKEAKGESLKEHLLSQINMMNLSQDRYALCEKLIHNLDEKGFHILSPLSILKSLEGKKSFAFLEECLSIVQSLDPPGLCVKNVEESLLVQAKEKNASPLTLFILDGHLDFINPPQAEKALKKITSFLEKQKELFGNNLSNLKEIQNTKIDEGEIQKSIDFIKKLDPFPARNFSSEDTIYITPDIHVEIMEEKNVNENFQNGIVSGKEKNFLLTLSNDFLPELSLNKDFETLLKNKKDSLESKTKKDLSVSLKKAKDFIEAVTFRQNTLLTACCIITKKQEDFFLYGPGYLKTFTQRELSKILHVHESTVSRLANMKYLQCHWGLFELKYFFTNAVNKNQSAKGPSHDQVLFTIKEILTAPSPDKKKLSDQQLANLLEKKGIKIARRTVAKYRAELNISSSYQR